MSDYRQQQANEELHERTVEILTSLVDVLDCEELSLLCFHCGVSTNELMPVEASKEFSSVEHAPFDGFI